MVGAVRHSLRPLDRRWLALVPVMLALNCLATA
jgi:hypothetical protein